MTTCRDCGSILLAVPAHEPLCATCRVIGGSGPDPGPAAEQLTPSPLNPVWAWSDPAGRQALASREVGAILRAYRFANGPELPVPVASLPFSPCAPAKPVIGEEISPNHRRGWSKLPLGQDRTILGSGGIQLSRSNSPRRAPSSQAWNSAGVRRRFGPAPAVGRAYRITEQGRAVIDALNAESG